MIRNNSEVCWLLSLSFLILSCSASKNIIPTAAPSPAGDELYRTIAQMDSVLFNAFNNRDVAKLKTLFREDLEFYHDKDGLTGYSHTIESFIGLAGKKENDLKRELIAGSLEVYPLKDFGAMQIGMHRFCHTENGKSDCGSFKFVHIWKKINGDWKISRVVSYGH